MRRARSLFDYGRLRAVVRRRGVQNTLTLFLVVTGPVLAGLTFLALDSLDRPTSGERLRLILLADLVYILVVAALVLMRVGALIAARRARSAGSRLHLRLTGVFALLALIPTVLVAVFAVLTVNQGLEGWFSDRVRTALGASLSAAEAYKEEERQEVARDGRRLASALNEERTRSFYMEAGEIRQALARLQEDGDYQLSEVYVIDGTGELRVRGARSYLFDFEPPTEAALEAVREGRLAIIEDRDNDEFRALIPMPAFTDRYLYVTRDVDGEILSLLDDTQETVALYQQLESERGRRLFDFGLIYLGFAVVLILAAVWLGLSFAERLARPIGRLVGASQRVGSGDLDVRVREEEGDDEIALLGRNFNEMTAQLKAQREELLRNTQQIERRRRLFDSVLSSVTSGVVGLDADGRVTFVNPSARALLGIEDESEAVALSVLVPEFAGLFEAVRDSQSSVQDQVNLIRGGKQETLLVRVAPRRSDDGRVEGYVVAFDDVTDLVSAQRMAAWGDVARRIAHEIKNPLTPIQLSAERIKRKFGRKLSDEEARDLEAMTDVIVRQTGDLRRIVDEFSKFARMPEPERRREDLAALVRDAVALQQAGQPGVEITADIPPGPVWAEIDATMIGQALTNLIKNAGEATETLQGTPGYTPRVHVALDVQGTAARITVTDNGVGLPEDRSRLFEPYVTTREKGTGLGLPIVKKIIEEHGGSLRLEDAPDGQGARAVIDLGVLAAEAGRTAAE